MTPTQKSRTTTPTKETAMNAITALRNALKHWHHDIPTTSIRYAPAFPNTCYIQLEWGSGGLKAILPVFIAGEAFFEGTNDEPIYPEDRNREWERNNPATAMEFKRQMALRRMS
jgi:hypothetical protein